MNSIRKWLYKPKRDDKSLLAQFFYADEELNIVAAELDSFDGRKDPERCTALVNHLRQCQDKVLNICNMIMDEIIGDERGSRDFRVKFPDDVLQENLAGQLWFGAECLAAGSSIMNREAESASMRPLAKALTKSLENVRNLLREQCFRNPPEFTEKIQESLKIFDRLFSEFELSYVSAMVPVKTMREYDIQQSVIVLFSETLQRSLNMQLLSQDTVDDYDPALMFTIPRLAIVCGLLIYPDGPLNVDRDPTDMSEMFRPFRTLLHKIRELLWTLSKYELYALEKALCSIEEPGEYKKTGRKDNRETTLVESYPIPDLDDFVKKFYTDHPNCKQFIDDFYTSNFGMSRSSSGSRTITSSTSRPGDEEIVVRDHVITSGENSDNDELTPTVECVFEDHPNRIQWQSLSASQEIHLAQHAMQMVQVNLVNMLHDHNTATDRNTTSMMDYTARNKDTNCSCSGNNSSAAIQKAILKCRHNRTPFRCSSAVYRNKKSNKGQSDVFRRSVSASEHRHSGGEHHNSQHHRLSDNQCLQQQSTSSMGLKGQREFSRSLDVPAVQILHDQDSSSLSSACSSCRSFSTANSEDCHSICSSSDTSSYNSECQDDEEIALAMQAAEIATRNEARAKFKSSEDLIHRLFVCVSGVADQLQTNYASDLRNILKCVFAINATPIIDDDDLSKNITTGLSNITDGLINNGLLHTIDSDERSSESPTESVENAEDVLATTDRETTDLLDGQPPPWVPDSMAPHCMACHAHFTIVRRRHHCRNCGKVFCARCSSNTVPLPQYGHQKAVRVCNRCFMYQVTPFTIEEAATT